MKNILLPLELSGSALETKLISIAISYSKEFNAKCWLVHVVAPNPDFVGYGVGPQYIRDLLAEDMREEHRKIQAISEDFREHKVNAEGLLVQGVTADMIKEEVKKLEIDLLILGNKKHNFLEKVFGTSVTHELVDEVNVPVLLVPEK